ncbi:MAG: hypothetical protein GYA36_19680 [Veillonellaceae bacterium]|nr:hypothetical protein [Veillonellaceae bacterium]
MWVDCCDCEYMVEGECRRHAPRPIVVFENTKTGEVWQNVSDRGPIDNVYPAARWPSADGGCGDGELSEEAKARKKR